jgi:hypothetical protein
MGLEPTLLSFAETAITNSGSHQHKMVPHVGIEPTECKAQHVYSVRRLLNGIMRDELTESY